MRAFTSISLWVGALVPVAYYGAQALAAPFFPDFSFLRHTASVLGSDLSAQPSILNTGAAITGILAALASPGPSLALKPSGRLWLGLLLGLCFLSFGSASLWAATFPLPDPRHDPGALGAGMFAAPFVACLAAFVVRLGARVRWYAVLNVAAFFLVAAAYSGLFSVDLAAYSGLLQRVSTVVMLVPLAVVSYALLPKRTGLAPTR